MKKYITAFSILCSLFIGHAQNELSTKINRLLTANYTADAPGISVLVAKDGKTIFKKAFGKSNLELHTAMTTENVFQIGSLTKQFTAVATLMLAEQGKLTINTAIGTYFPDFPKYTKNITIHQLLNHTSGIKNSTPLGNKGFSSRKDMNSHDLVAFIKNNPLDFEPGSRFKYSNAGYILLGRIIEIVTEKSYKDYIEENIFKKLNMQSTSYGSTKTIIKNRASGYQNQQHTFVNAEYMSLTLPFAAGAIMTTIADMHRWHTALLNFSVLKKESLQKAMSPSRLNNEKRIPYGYGWRIAQLQGSRIIAHTGSTKGFRSTAMFFPKENIYMVLLSNCNCTNIPDINKAIANIIVNKPSPKTPVKTVTIPAEKLQKFVGKYIVKPGVAITISYKNNALFLTAPKQTSSIALFPENEFQYYMKKLPAKIKFNSNKKGQVTGLILTQSGRKIMAIKQ